VVAGGVTVDVVLVGPNGVFTVVIDPDPARAVLDERGLIRAGAPVRGPIENALGAAFSLRRSLGEAGVTTLPYPIVVAPVGGEGGFAARVRVVPPHRLPEAVWSHPGMPLTRAERRRALAVIARLGGDSAGGEAGGLSGRLA
jgi:hypothetical protein